MASARLKLALASGLLSSFGRHGGFVEARRHNPERPLIQDVSVIDLLILDHQFLKDSCRILIERDADRPALIAVGRKFLDSLRIHSSAEKRCLYQELREHEELHFNILEAEAEHRVIDAQVERLAPKLKTLRGVKDETLADLRALAEVVLNHLLEEEGDLLLRINEEVDEATLIELGEKFMKLRRFSADELAEFPIAGEDIIEWKDNLQKMQGRYFARIDSEVLRLRH